MAEEGVGTSTPNVSMSNIPHRIKLTDQQFMELSSQELICNWHEQDSFIDYLESQVASLEASLRDAEERLRQQRMETTLREKMLVRKLTLKEEEAQEYSRQITEFRAKQSAGSSNLNSTLLDPAVNLLLQSLRSEIVSIQTRLEETQNELTAWKFTPDSNTGKRLMAKCRQLYQENEELGRMISSGRLAKLEGELALQKCFSEEVKSSQSELDEFLQDMEEDVEGMQGTIYHLQKELRKSKEAYSNLQKQFNSLPSEARSGFILPVEPSTSRGHEIFSSEKVKSGPPPSSSASLLMDEPFPQALHEYAGHEACDKRSVKRSKRVDDSVPEAPSSTSGEECAASPMCNHFESSQEETSVLTYSEVTELTEEVFINNNYIEQSAFVYSEMTECDGAVRNENNIGNENTEESGDQDSRVEVKMEVASNSSDTEDDEKGCEREKIKEKFEDIVSVNGVINDKVVGMGHEGQSYEQRKKKKKHSSSRKSSGYSSRKHSHSKSSKRVHRHCRSPSQ